MVDRKQTKPATGTVESDAKDDGPRMPRVATAALVAIVMGGAVFYLWLAFWRNDSAMWSNVGQAVGPFVALLNAGALFAALYSVRLQRYELELQRAELRGHREVMEEQRKQFERTAKAQEQLATSQQRLAFAQEAANRQAVMSEIATRDNSSATISAAQAACYAALANDRYVLGELVQKNIDWLRERVQYFDKILEFNQALNEQLRAGVAADAEDANT